MIKILVKPSRKVIILNDVCVDDVGVQNEHQATTLNFEFPDKIENIPISQLTKEFVWKHAKGSGKAEIIGNEFSLKSIHTQCKKLFFQVRLTKGTNIEWKTIPMQLTLSDTLPLPTADDPLTESDCVELALDVAERYGSNLSENSDFETVISAISQARTQLTNALNANYGANLTEESTFSQIISAISQARTQLTNALNANGASLTAQSTYSEVISALSFLDKAKTIVQIINSRLNTGLDVNNYTSQQINTKLSEISTKLSDYDAFWSCVVNWINPHVNYRFNSSNKTFAQVTTALVSEIDGIIENLQYELNYYKLNYEALINSTRAVDDQVDWDSFTFDSETEEILEEISESSLDSVEEFKAKADEYDGIKQGLYELYTGTGNYAPGNNNAGNNNNNT